MKGKIANEIYYSTTFGASLADISKSLHETPPKILYHLNQMVNEKLIIRQDNTYFLSDIFYLSNGTGIVEKVFTTSFEVLKMGLDFEEIEDKSTMISVLKLILLMVESDMN